MTDELKADIKPGSAVITHTHHYATDSSPATHTHGDSHHTHTYDHDESHVHHHNYASPPQTKGTHMDAALAALLSKEGHSGDKGMLGGIGGILIGLLLGRTGLLGNNWDGGGRGHNGGAETRLELNTDLNTVEMGLQNLTQDVAGVSRDVLQSACNTQAAISAEGRNIDNKICTTDQLIAASQTALTNLLYQNTIDNNQQLAGINLAIATTAANAAADRSAIAANLSREITQASFAAEKSAAATQLLVEREAAATRQLIEANRSSDFQARIIELTNALAEAKGDRRARETEINITQSVNQAQAQNQFQLQQQQVNNAILSALQTLVQDNQIARATNSVFQIGNTGVAATGAQSANPINVRG